MELYNDTSGPTVDKGVLARMERLDTGLVLTFSTYGINPATTEPMEIKIGPDFAEFEDMARFHRRGNAWFLYDPSFYLWTKDPDGKWHLIMTYPADTGFGHKEVQKLEADVARYMRPSDIVREMYEAKSRNEAKQKADYQSGRRDMLGANESVIRDTVGGKRGVRQAKIVSYPGQGNRSTPGDIVMDDKEAGWEKLDDSGR